MGIGVSIFLIAVGAILTFALDVSLGGVDIDVVGWILMAAGALGLIFTMFIWGPRRSERNTRVTHEPSEYHEATAEHEHHRNFADRTTDRPFW